ncbi:MAG: hypothetical protein H5T64_10610 [Chloroflexi bacterium]|nr:hypothetical protein [Chloroflexota bacterium]
MTKELEFRSVTGEALVKELQARVEQMSDPERKYDVQVGLKDVEFRVNEKCAAEMGISLPLRGIDQAEDCLQARILVPTRFVETDGTVHQVIWFDPTPVGYSGFMDCVTHSLALTDRGLFELGRYLATRLAELSKAWHWFIHRRWMKTEEVEELERTGKSPEQIVDLIYAALTGKTRGKQGREGDDKLE